MEKTLAEKFSEATGIHEPYASEILNDESYASWRLPSGSVHQDREELIAEIGSKEISEEPEEMTEDQEVLVEEQDSTVEDTESEPETIAAEPVSEEPTIDESEEDSKIEVE